MELITQNRSFAGIQKVFSHNSVTTKGKMRFAIYLPDTANQKLPVLWWLSGLTCTEENFITKAGAQRYAAEMNLIVVAPDTSPRGAGIAGEDDAYDFGTGAGFYINATNEPWVNNYKMFSYITEELPELIEMNFPVDKTKQGICGHSMGGHGALISALICKNQYKSVSALSPICNPINCDWGTKAFTGYLGNITEEWKKWDATELVKQGYKCPPILIDQG